MDLFVSEILPCNFPRPVPTDALTLKAQQCNYRAVLAMVGTELTPWHRTNPPIEWLCSCHLSHLSFFASNVHHADDIRLGEGAAMTLLFLLIYVLFVLGRYWVTQKLAVYPFVLSTTVCHFVGLQKKRQERQRWRETFQRQLWMWLVLQSLVSIELQCFVFSSEYCTPPPLLFYTHDLHLSGIYKVNRP